MSSAPTFRIVIEHLRGSAAGRTEVYAAHRLDALRFGRDALCEVRFDAELDDLVSRHHAALQWRFEAGRWRFELIDLVSSNGSFVNGKAVDGSTNVHDGDVLDFGHGGPRVRVRIDSSPAKVNPVTATNPPFRGDANATQVPRDDV